MLFTITLSTQPFGKPAENYRISKLNYENSGGEKASTIFVYDNSGKIFKGYWALLDESRSSINYYEYDAYGLLISVFREFSDSLTSDEIFSYDSLGQKVSENYHRSDNISGSASYKYKDDILKQAVFRNHKGWLNGQATYSYDDQKRRIIGVLTKNDTTVCNINYEYDIENNLVKEHWDFNGKWSQTFYYKYEEIESTQLYYCKIRID